MPHFPGSLDSNAEESQNGKEKDKSKAAKQLHSVQKAFGSIGRPFRNVVGNVSPCVETEIRV